MPDASRPRRRVAAGSLERFVRSAAGGLLLRPWFDEAALRVLTQWYFPLSRGWAAALAAQGSVAAFLEALPCGRFSRRLLPGILAHAQGREAVLQAADAHWDEAFFGDGKATAEAEAQPAAGGRGADQRSLVAAAAAHDDAAATGAWDVEPEVAVAKRHGRRLAHPERAFEDDFEAGAVEPSRGFLTHHGVDGWVRFRAGAPCAGTGPAWARVSAPLVAEAPAMPTLIFTHGIGMETEFTGDGRNPLRALVAAGIRVIRPEGPWHGRRRLDGSYGGEPVLARGPGGMLDYLHAHVIEIGRLTAWARATRGGPVAIGGISLGALTTQLAAVAANHWPEEARPDALFLVAPSLSLSAVTFEGSLTPAWACPTRFAPLAGA